MLYDPKWESTTTDPLTLRSFIAWLELQPRSKTYDYGNCRGECLLDQYGAAVGHLHVAAHRMKIAAVFGSRGNYRYVCGEGAWTFGAALARACELQAKQLSSAAAPGE